MKFFAAAALAGVSCVAAMPATDDGCATEMVHGINDFEQSLLSSLGNDGGDAFQGPLHKINSLYQTATECRKRTMWKVNGTITEDCLADFGKLRKDVVDGAAAVKEAAATKSHEAVAQALKDLEAVANDGKECASKCGAGVDFLESDCGKDTSTVYAIIYMIRSNLEAIVHSKDVSRIPRVTKQAQQLSGAGHQMVKHCKAALDINVPNALEARVSDLRPVAYDNCFGDFVLDGIYVLVLLQGIVETFELKLEGLAAVVDMFFLIPGQLLYTLLDCTQPPDAL